MDLPNLRRETIYGMPAADKILFNRHYVLGYSYYFRQAKWALEIVDQASGEIERLDNFRPDYRIPEIFRADLADFEGSNFHRGHLVASGNQIDSLLQNSETFLLSNMSPQQPSFNQGVWRTLETKVRELNAEDKIYETYVICGPIFYFDQAVESIGTEDGNGVSIPIPHAYFKSVLVETNRGTLRMYSFVIPNDAGSQDLSDYMVKTTEVEKYAGIKLWERLEGKKIEKEKNKIRRMW